MKNICLRSGRLLLVPASCEALKERRERESDPEMIKAYGDMLRGCEEHPQEWLWYTEWDVLLKKNGKRVGGVNFKGRNPTWESEIGYGIDEEYRNMGYCSEAVRRLMSWAFSNGLYFVNAQIEVGNEPSLHVLKRLGFKPDGMGDEGPRYVKERPPTYYALAFACLFTAIGICVGALINELDVGLMAGLGLGILIGAICDEIVRRKMDRYSRQRNTVAVENNEEKNGND